MIKVLFCVLRSGYSSYLPLEMSVSQTSQSWIQNSLPNLAMRHVRPWPIEACLPLWCNLGERVQTVLTHTGCHAMAHTPHEISSTLIQHMGQNELLSCTHQPISTTCRCHSRCHQPCRWSDFPTQKHKKWSSLISLSWCRTPPPTDQTHSASSVRDWMSLSSLRYLC